ncbi:MAG: DNA recombination protein RmuC, partial [Patescibacteria group bacterium]
MDIGLVLLVGIVLLTFVVGLLWLKSQIQKITKESNSDKVMLEWLKSSQANIDQSLHQNTQAINSRLDNTAQVIAEVKRNIGEMSEIGRSVKQLQNFLSSPKLRGNIGEQVLKELLGQSLPKNSFNLQYTFKSGATVDAAIKTSAGIIAIDSKFPMENFGKINEIED